MPANNSNKATVGYGVVYSVLIFCYNLVIDYFVSFLHRSYTSLTVSLN